MVTAHTYIPFRYIVENVSYYNIAHLVCLNMPGLSVLANNDSGPGSAHVSLPQYDQCLYRIYCDRDERPQVLLVW